MLLQLESNQFNEGPDKEGKKIKERVYIGVGLSNPCDLGNYC